MMIGYSPSRYLLRFPVDIDKYINNCILEIEKYIFIIHAMHTLVVCTSWWFQLKAFVMQTYDRFAIHSSLG